MFCNFPEKNMKTSVYATRWVVACVLVVAVATQVPPFKETCETGKYPPPKKNHIPTVSVNLDLPPQKRWTKVVQVKKNAIKNLIGAFKKFISDFNINATKVLDLVDKEFPKLAETLPPPYGDEMKGIAADTGIPLGEIVFYNVFYEIFTVCTSIVAQDPKGKLFHARNLDFGLFLGWDIKNNTWEITEMLRPAIINVNYIKNGKTLFKAVHYAGYIGVLTAVKPNYFTLSMNERFNVDGGYIGILQWLLGDHNAQWMSFLTRDVLEYAESYDQAKHKLSTVPLLAPAYYILGGNKSGQACVITRARDSALDIWEMSSSDSNSNFWYLLETNYDHWKAPLFVDDRRTPGNRCMGKMTQKNVSFEGLFNVLTSKPVLNQLTTYTALMQVGSGILETYLQYCDGPCWPF